MFLATTVNDKVMYVVLVAAIVAGLATTLMGAGVVGEHNYRDTVSPWFRSIWILQPRGELLVEAPVSFQIHTLIGLVLFAIWPFTRLVHVFSAPVGYLTRPYIVYRSRDDRPGTATGSRVDRRRRRGFAARLTDPAVSLRPCPIDCLRPAHRSCASTRPAGRRKRRRTGTVPD